MVSNLLWPIERIVSPIVSEGAFVLIPLSKFYLLIFIHVYFTQLDTVYTLQSTVLSKLY